MRPTLLMMALALSACGRTALIDEPADVPELRLPDAGAVVDGGSLISTVFMAAPNLPDWELFITDGTAERTRRLGAVVSGMSGVPSPGTSFARRFYFPCTLPAFGAELCVTDGTPEGTGLFRDLAPGPESSGATELVVAAERLYFLTAPHVLWESDGTPDGTRPLVTSEGTIFLLASDETGLTFWADGVLERVARGQRTVLGAHADPVMLGASVGDTFFFSGFDLQHGRELWRTTATGLERVSDILPGPASGLSSFHFVVAGGRLYFQARAPSDETWLFSVAPGEAPQPVHRAGWGIPMTTFGDGCVFFFERQLWLARADGLRLVTNIENVWAPTVVAGQLYFQSRIGAEFAVWRLEGDVPRKLQTFSEQPFALAESGGKLYLRGADEQAGREPWVISGDVVRRIDLQPGARSSWPANFGVLWQ